FIVNDILISISLCIYHYTMPIVTVSMYSGRTQREKDRLAEAMTEDIAKILNIKKEEVIIVFQEAPHGNWYSSGIRL
ncbi:MAG: tautomerase family protein, partial [Nitrososphaeraceae archaeon]